MKKGIELIAEERATHAAKGWTEEHDETHSCGELGFEAVALICNKTGPFNLAGKALAEGGRKRQLVVAGALIAAEIDQLQRYTQGTNEVRG